MVKVKARLLAVGVGFTVKSRMDERISSPRKGSLYTFLLNPVGSTRDLELISLLNSCSDEVPLSF